MHTAKTLSPLLKIEPSSILRNIDRHNEGKFTQDQKLPDVVVERLLSKGSAKKNGAQKDFKVISAQEILIRPTPLKRKERPQSVKRSTPVKKKSDFLKVLQVLPLPMLGLAASYGVYFFASQFVPYPVAIIEAAAFELTYIGLASMTGLSPSLRTYARIVSIGAVIVSVIYNTIAGAIHQDSTIIQDLSAFWFWLIAVLHGAPLAILAYFVADLIFHQKK